VDPFNPNDFGRAGQPMPPSEEEQNSATRAGDVFGGTAEGAGFVADIVEGVSSAASAVGDAVGSVASGVADVAGGAAEAVGGVAEGVGGAAEGVGSAVGAVAEGCGSCSLALLVMLVSVGAAVAAVLR
jgi:hypothetical protein